MFVRLFFLIFLVSFFSLEATALIRGGRSNGIVIPTPDLNCTITTGNCTGSGGGTSLFAAATCNGDGVTDDAAAFRSWNSWLITSYRPSNPTKLVQLTIPTGKTCQFITGNVNNNSWGKNAGLIQTVGYGAEINDNNGTGGGFFLGCGSCGMQFNGTASSVRIATASVGATSITLLDTSKCSLFNNGDYFLVTGIDTQGFGDPPNVDRLEWPQINSTASCAGTGVITLIAPLLYNYKSTWPLYNAGDPGHSDQGGPGTAYQLNGGWGITQQSVYGLRVNQPSAQVNANGRSISLYDISCPTATCVIPSQTLNWSATNYSAPGAAIEFDKLVSNVTITNMTIRRMLLQSGQRTAFTCTNCTITPIGINGTVYDTTFINSHIDGLQLGASCCGISHSFTAINTNITDLQLTGANFTDIDKRGTWSGATLTVPANMHINSSQSACAGACTQLNVVTSAGWVSGIIGDGPGNTDCAGTFVITVINSTTVTIPIAWSGNSCFGGFGSLPFGSNGSMMVPGANIFMTTGGHGSPTSQVLQVDDLFVGVNGETIFTFKQNGVSYTNALPVMPSGTITTQAHPSPIFNCIGCTGDQNVTDLNGFPSGPVGSQVSRIVTATNGTSGAPSMLVFGPLIEMDTTVTTPCNGASNFGILPFAFIATLGSTSFGSWVSTVNAQTASGTPRVVTQTTSSGGQSGDLLTPPGSGTLILTGQSTPFYSSVGNCSSASTTITIKTDQGVVP